MKKLIKKTLMKLVTDGKLTVNQARKMMRFL